MESKLNSPSVGVNLGSLARLPVRLSRCHPSGWLYVLYDRLLNSRLGRKFPFRRRVVRIRLRGHASPFYLRLGTTDWMVLDELYLVGEYHGVPAAVPGQVRCVLDLGANVGYSARLWHEFFPQAEIFAVEPDGANLRVCDLNCRVLGHQFRSLRAFVGVAPGAAALDRSRGEWGIRIGATVADGSGVEGVPVMTISGILEAAGWDGDVSLVKCDIEGAEWEVFAHCRPWINRVSTLLIELHGKSSLPEFQQLLSQNGANFDVTTLQLGEGYALLLLTRKPLPRPVG